MTWEQYETYLIKSQKGRYLETQQNQPLSQREQKEKQIHNQILEWCEKSGWYVIHSRMDRPTTIQKGAPDFVIAAPNGRTIWIEVKAGRCKPTEQQLVTMARLKRLGHEYYLLNSFKEFLKITERSKNDEDTARDCV